MLYRLYLKCVPITLLVVCLAVPSILADESPVDSLAAEKLHHMSVVAGLSGPLDSPGRVDPRLAIESGISGAATLDLRIKSLGYVGATIDLTYMQSNRSENVTQTFWGVVAKFALSQAPERVLLRPGIAYGQANFNGFPGNHGHAVMQLRLITQAAYLFTDRPGYILEVLWVKSFEDRETNTVWEPGPYMIVRAGITF